MSEIRETECRNKTLSWFLEKVVKYTNSIWQSEKKKKRDVNMQLILKEAAAQKVLD